MVTSGGRFNIRRQSLALAGPPISAKNRGGGGGGCALIWNRALIQENTVLRIYGTFFVELMDVESNDSSLEISLFSDTDL